MAVVTLATRADVRDIADLLEELDRFYGATQFDALSRRVAQIEALLFGPTPAAFVLLARGDDAVVGLAAYSYLWPAAGITRSLFLKELYVREVSRKKGIGRELMRAICEVASNNDCSRVEWATEHSNTGAMQFYASLGAPLSSDKVFYRLDAQAIQRVATT